MTGKFTKRVWGALGTHSDASWEIAGSVVVQAATLCTGVIAARVLTVEDRGRYGLVVAGGMALLQLFHLGMPMSLAVHARQLVGHPGRVRAVMYRSLPRAALLAVSSAFLVAIMSKGDLPLAIAAFVASVLYLPAHWLLALIQGGYQIPTNAILKAVSPVVQLAITLGAWLALGRLTLFSILIIWNASILVGILVSAVVLVKLTGLRREPVTGTAPSAKGVASYGRNGFVAHVGVNDLIRIDVLLVSLLAGPETLGQFYAIIGLAGAPKVTVDGLSTALFVRYTTAGSWERAVVTARKAAILVTGGGLAVMLLILPWSDELIQWLLGAKYSGLGLAWSLFFMAAVLQGSRRLILDPYRALGRPATASYKELVSLPSAALLALVILLVPGINGVAIGSVASAALALILSAAIPLPARLKERESGR